MGVHHVVAVGLDGHHLVVNHREALFATIARPEVVGTYTYPWADCEVDATAYSRRLLVARLGVEVLIPHAVSP